MSARRDGIRRPPRHGAGPVEGQEADRQQRAAARVRRIAADQRQVLGVPLMPSLRWPSVTSGRSRGQGDGSAARGRHARHRSLAVLQPTASRIRATMRVGFAFRIPPRSCACTTHHRALDGSVASCCSPLVKRGRQYAEMLRPQRHCPARRASASFCDLRGGATRQHESRCDAPLQVQPRRRGGGMPPAPFAAPRWHRRPCSPDLKRSALDWSPPDDRPTKTPPTTGLAPRGPHCGMR